jgi:nucleoid DNA-binding protein
MTITEIAEIVARRTGSHRELVWGYTQELIETIVKVLDSGEEVRIRGLGTLRWVWVPGKKFPISKKEAGKEIPDGMKLKFFPAWKFKTRRTTMSDDEGMTKYAVVQDEEKTKEASESAENTERACPVCLELLDDAGACPVHGTEPFEPTG